MAVLERQLHPEVPFQTAANGIGGQRSQQLSPFELTRWGDLMIGELKGWFGQLKLGDHATDHLPGIRQRLPHTLDELGIINLALLCTLQQSDRNLKRHRYLRY